MTPEQLQRLREMIARGRQPDEAMVRRYGFPRGWNEALAFVERCIKQVTEGAGA